MECISVQENVETVKHEMNVSMDEIYTPRGETLREPTGVSIEYTSTFSSDTIDLRAELYQSVELYPVEPSSARAGVDRSRVALQRPHRLLRIQRNLKSDEHAQQSMHNRFAKLTPKLLSSEPFAIYSTHKMQPPPGFEECWLTYRESHTRRQLSAVESDLLTRAFTCIIFCNTKSKDHMQYARDIAASVSSLGSLAPCIMLASHMTCVEPERPAGQVVAEANTEFLNLTSALDAGFDDFILGEPYGVQLACAVKSRIMQQVRNVELLNEKVSEQRALIQHVIKLEDDIYDAVWRYLRLRMKIQLPEIDEDIEPGHPAVIDGFVVGAKLGEGSFGVVCKLLDPRNGTSQVLKMVDKRPLTNFRGIVNINRQINLMEMVSSEEYKHPNIIEYYDVYHSETHVFFRMEDGGQFDLYKRLAIRDNGSDDMPISISKARNLITQCLSAISHLHIRTSIVHRDLKPENIILSETEDGMIVKISDLDTARVMLEGEYCCGSVGTFPFMAPEILREQMYNPFAADVWSLGVVFLEVVCRLNLLKRALTLQSPKRATSMAEKQNIERRMLDKIYSFFAVQGHASLMLETHVHPNLHDILSGAHDLVPKMLEVQLDERWTADDLSRGSVAAAWRLMR